MGWLTQIGHEPEASVDAAQWASVKCLSTQSCKPIAKRSTYSCPQSARGVKCACFQTERIFRLSCPPPPVLPPKHMMLAQLDGLNRSAGLHLQPSSPISRHSCSHFLLPVCCANLWRLHRTLRMIYPRRLCVDKVFRRCNLATSPNSHLQQT